MSSITRNTAIMYYLKKKKLRLTTRGFFYVWH